MILEEVDSMTLQAQASLRRILETVMVHTRFIFTANNVNNVFEPILSRCTLFEFKPLTHNNFMQLIKLHNLDISSIDSSTLDHIIFNSHGDARKLLNQLLTPNSTTYNLNNKLLMYFKNPNLDYLKKEDLSEFVPLFFKGLELGKIPYFKDKFHILVRNLSELDYKLSIGCYTLLHIYNFILDNAKYINLN